MNTIRLPWQHAIFVTEILKHGDREAAYGKAYPNAKPNSRKPAACRLASRPEIKQVIEEKQSKAIRKGFEAAEAEAAERYKQEFLSITDKRMELADIVRRKARMNRYYKDEGEIKHIEVTVDNPFAILRAIELDTKLEAEYFAKKPKEEKATKPGKLPRLEPGMYQRFVYIGKEPFEKTEYDPLTDEEYDNLIRASLTDPEIIIPEPILTPQLQKFDCHVERDMDTGKYEIVCPADKVELREENGEMVYYGINEEGTNGLTTVNTDDAQLIENQQQGKSQETNSKSQTPEPPLGGKGVKPAEKTSLLPGGGREGRQWFDADAVVQEYFRQYREAQTYKNMMLHRNMVKLYKSYGKPEQAALEKQTGWEFHPEDESLIRIRGKK